MKTANIVSISGGKDSTAELLLAALERKAENLMVVFCDTGHEHAQTYEYVRYLERFLGIPIRWVKADWSAAIARKRARIASDQRHGRAYRMVVVKDAQGQPVKDRSGKPVKKRVGGGRRVRWTNKAKRRALAALYATGNPFLDMCLCRGRFPSTKARFCTEELKTLIFSRQVIDPLLEAREFDRINVWVGVRADESASRAKMAEWEAEFADPETGAGLWTYRPILEWTAADAFAIHRRYGIEPNPLYMQGMSRVGCMPCVNSRKGELREIARRFPEEIDRIAEWERLVSMASKRGCSTFWPARGVERVTLAEHGIKQVIEWSRTSRGGRQYDLIASIEADEGRTGEAFCSSVYGLCE